MRAGILILVSRGGLYEALDLQKEKKNDHVLLA